MDDLSALLHSNFPALSWPKPELQALAELVGTRKLARGRSLFLQGQSTQAFYAVLSGEIEARFSGLGGEVSVLEHVQPPRLFGLAAFAAAQASSYEAVARQPTQLLVFGPAAYELLMDRVPGFARALLAEFAQRYDGTLRLLEASRHRTAAERFQLALAQLTRERGRGSPDAEGGLSVKASQAELAALANLSRQTVNQLLAQAVARGELRCGYGRLWVRQRG
ncbi:Crp/Fnr family transcriptional regulator [Roseateles oligotrophus]|uniref:Crp/Fnr family transcriptional regulator n=1 Tax=Roseateles oligotrophus TaxID=1769250 RepID=A0ABT2YD73_9BURK|nr:Crp/Fnr family transcriptional regulator [Roseateles oligotrophus]MCV2367984.1 Crp/Fnr family transcriptional regulator [Roseateles oligotrophus]